MHAIQKAKKKAIQKVKEEEGGEDWHTKDDSINEKVADVTEVGGRCARSTDTANHCEISLLPEILGDQSLAQEMNQEQLPTG